ncbi:MAG: hypothetical protein DRP51_07460 [Candidatus Zixiibacteriota bacterium]|nr:MAG: hypothetical protein DRP51_07460 [candidate division Zixibacteria bacterium]
MKKWLVYLGIFVLALFLYFVVTEPITFSTTVSYIIIGLILLVIIFIFVRTIQGNFVGRKTVFVFVGIAVVLPFFMTVTQRIELSPEVASLYNSIENLKPGSKVLISFDYDPPSAPELQPMAETFFYYCFKNDLKVLIMGLWPQGPQQADLAIQKALANPDIASKNIQYGVDYINLGFQAGNEFVIQRMGSSFKSMFPSDFYGTPFDSLPLADGVTNFSNIDFSMNLSAGYPGTIEWVQVAVDRYGVNLGAGNTAVQAPQVYPYLNSGQLKGLLGGLNGAAEFEKVVGVIGKGTKFMVSQSAAHVVVIAFIIIGNAAFFLGDRRRKEKEAKETADA